MRGYESVFLCARVLQHGWLRGVGGLGVGWGLGHWPSSEAGPFTSAHKTAEAAALVLAALFVGDNGPKSKTDSLLRGNAEPASELIKQLLCISQGMACLMSDTKRGILASSRPCKKEKEETKILCPCNLWCLSQFYSKQLWLIKA